MPYLLQRNDRLRFGFFVGVLSAIAVAIFCGGCSPPDSGEVIDRKFVEAHSEQYTQSVYPTIIYGYRWVEDRWWLHLRDTEQAEGWRRVDKATYDAHPVGSWYQGDPR